MNIGLEYIKYRWKAANVNSKHSHPTAVNDILNGIKTSFNAYQRSREMEALFKQLKNNNASISIQDFGAGSKHLSNSRTISSIFKTSSSKGKYGQLLFAISNHFKPKYILEFGTSLGIGTLYMHLGQPTAEITTLEGCPETYKIAKRNLETFKTSKINGINSTFYDYLNSLNQDKQFDLVFIDGHHDGQALLNYLDRLQDHTDDSTVFILDDIRWSSSMLDAWEKIVENKNYSITLDFFRFGLVIPAKNTPKTHLELTI